MIMMCIGPLIPIDNYPELASDVRIELEAELTHNASIKYKKITIHTD